MATTKINDLKGLRLGAPYLYCHSGGCQHLISFVDIRYLPAETSGINKVTMSWPRVLYRRPLKRKKCVACSTNKRRNVNYSKFVVYDHKLVDRSPTFFCEECYDKYHYNNNGTLLYDQFKVYPYYHEL